MEHPPLRFLSYMLNHHKNPFFASFYLTQICSFLKDNLEKKPPVATLYSRLFQLTKSKILPSNKEYLYFFLIFRATLMEEKSFFIASGKEKLLNYGKVIEILRASFRDYEIYDSFMELFPSISAQHIKNQNPLLDKIATKFSLGNKIEAVEHLKTLLTQNDHFNKKCIPFQIFKQLMKETYEINIESEEMQENLSKILNEEDDVHYLNLVNEMNKNILIELYACQNVVLDCLIQVYERNSIISRQKLFSDLFEQKELFNYETFSKRLMNDLNINFSPLIFSSLHYENQFFKIHDNLKKRLTSGEDPQSIYLGDFYNKSKLNERFCEVLDFLEFLNHFGQEFTPPCKVQRRQKTFSIGKSSEKSDGSEKNRRSKAKRDSMMPRASLLVTKKISESPRKSNASNTFKGLSFILANKPFKKTGRSVFNKQDC